MRGKYLRATALVALLSAFQPMAWAQQEVIATEAATVVEVQAGVLSYAPSFFTAFSPSTALDMVQRVPGFSLSGGDEQRRGLADSFGNLLINGARPSNKSLSLQTVLQRINAGDVERIELIQEALPQYDMRGNPRLVNVILREGAGNSGSWAAVARLSESHRIGPGGEISYKTQVGSAEMTFGFEGGWQGNLFRRRESLYDNGGQDLAELRWDNDQRHFQEFIPTFSLNWRINDTSSLRTDLRYQTWEWRRNHRSNVVDGTGADLRFEESSADDENTNWSLSSTYSRDFSDNFSSETIALVTREEWTNNPEFFSIYLPTTGFDRASIYEGEGEYKETAIRQTFSYNPNDRHAVEFGGETAVNSRDTDFTISVDDGTTVTMLDLPVSDTMVEETRSELFANHTWTVTDRISLESGLRYEFSEIEQTGDAEQSRSFTYAKPSFTLNYRQDDQNRYRVTLRRDVAQLNFGRFASQVDLTDNNSTLGNPDYVPQRTWTLEGEWERRFGDGSFSLVIGYDSIQDLDGWVPIESNGTVFDAPGNIGDGSNFRVTTNITSPLDNLGLSNAVLDVFLEYYDTNVEDPLTMVDRHWSGYRMWELRLDYRQTFPERQFAWGWDYFWLSDGEIFRAQEYRVQGFTDGDLDLYVETTRWLGLTLRAGVDGVINNGDDRERVFYDGSRADGIIDRIEYQNESMGKTFYIRARGTF
ncbi:TonB-dependent receptor [Maricaulis sp.]|uniref:TonB-dependent receptor plug domain-containing protein n=1 Tax=Maricaulis sp. TaxID=1486257 RepID=UPI001B2F7C57|nr:TonB-dependent receptor [Maricaulis sp.]MBO6797589.1 TonB-dependent receptor [Maricaulis sp.]